jgi:GH15 family glucan-1,4-alpha-glucosidase
VANAADRSGGSIVASIARQTPYSEDWTRDGAFLNYALDLAGHPEMVEKHNLFYARAQRANGTWGTMYYADGEEGGPFPYESDQQGFGTWTLWQHYVMYPSKSYLDAVYPAIRASANWMTLYAEPTGRQGPGMEDDNFFPSDGLQGAVTQWMGLQSAVRAAGVMNDAADAAKWSARAATLKATILSKYWGPSGSFSPGSSGIAQNLLYEGDPNSAAWIIWPAGLLDPSVPAEREKLFVLARYLYDYMGQQIATAPQLFYEQKAIASLGVYLGMGFNLICSCDPGRVREWSDLYHGVLRTPTWHFGEQIWRTGPNTWVDRVDMPHVWSGVYVYLDAISVTRPSLMPYRPWQ